MIKGHNQRAFTTNKVMGYPQLVELIAKHSNKPNDLLMALENEKSFLNLIADNDKLKGKFEDYELICHVIKAFALIIDSDPELLITYLAKLSKKDFETPISRYLTRFNAYLSKNRDLHLTAFDNLVKFLHKFQTILPIASREKVSMISPHLENTLNLCNKKEDVINKKTIDLIKSLSEEIERSAQTLELNGMKAAEEEIKHSINRPPNDFRHIPICPTVEDIHQTGKPFLRSNIVKGKYLNVDHYLDVQFRLLREDFVRPLREGISEYLNALKTNKQMRKLKDIRLYSNVHIGVSHQLSDGLITEATFDTTHFKNIRWQVFKHLLVLKVLIQSVYDWV
jgi:hypothetical protein